MGDDQERTLQHGGDLTEAMARYGGDHPPWLDLSTGINPHPWPVPPDLDLGWSRLPSRRDEAGLLAAARRGYAVPDDLDIVAGPGSQALIQQVPRIADASARVAIAGPTYGEHEAVWRAAGLPVETGSGGRPAATHAVVVNPNNPDGAVTPIPDLLETAERCAAKGGFLVVDESFADLDPSLSIVPHVATRPVLVLRSFGKFYGLAGLRLGFAIGPKDLVETIRRALGPWAVSGPAHAIGAAALADEAWAKSMRTQLACEADTLDGVLAAAGLTIVGGTSLYRLAVHPDAQALHGALAAEHVWTRSFDGQPDRLRFGLPPDAAALARLAAALDRAKAALDPHQAHGTSTVSSRCRAR